MVSVVIPTYRRAPELRRAVASVLAQTYGELEIVVVSDGPDEAARAVVEGFRDGRLIYMELPVNKGPAAARNAGVKASSGEWIAFLDDDDVMLPEKIARQRTAAEATRPLRMIACRAVYRHDGRDDIWPQRPIGSDEDVADYLLVRPSLLGRPGVISLGMLMVHRSVLGQVPFSMHDDHEDWAWLLEAWHKAGARVEFVWEPLVVYNIATDAMSRSRRMNWRESMAWAEEYRPWMSDRAYGSFLATKVAMKAKRAGDWAGLREIATRVMRSRPRVLDVLFLMGVLMLPGAVLQGAWRRSLREG